MNLEQMSGQIVAVLEFNGTFRTPKEFFRDAGGRRDVVRVVSSWSSQVLLQMGHVLAVGRENLSTHNTRETARFNSRLVVLSDVIMTFKMFLIRKITQIKTLELLKFLNLLILP